MTKIPIYAAERDVPGLEEKILSLSHVQYACQITSTEQFAFTEKTQAKLDYTQHAKANESIDLHYLKSILATSCWNKNDDIFDAYELWAARHTPEDKPFNYGHNCADIIGHITGSYAVDADGAVIADDSVVDSLPAKFHVVASAVLYKFWSIDSLQERMDTILAEIEEGEWFVSMECLFHGFDYVLKSDAGECTVVARNEKTAFLTKHLRCYGGDGTYQKQRVGRLMRNIVFCGKGLVKKPANPESVIFAEVESFNTTSIVSEIPSEIKNLGYGNATVNNSVEKSNKEQDTKMPEPTPEMQALQNQVEAANKTIAELKAAAVANDTKKLTDELVTVKANVDLITKAKETVEATLKTTSDELAALKTKFEETEASHKEVNEKLAKIEAEQKVTARLATVTDKLKMTGDPAKNFVESLASLSDDQFNKNVESLVATVVKTPPKGTPAATAPKATNFPVAGSKASENDSKASDANPEVLETAVPEPEATLATTTDSGVNKVAMSVASYFGVEADEE